MRNHLLGRTLGGLALSIVLLGACSGGDSTSPGTSTDFSGSYTLQSLTAAGMTIIPPLASGTLTLTASSYTFDVTVAVPGQPTIHMVDAGTYTFSGSSWTQNSSTTGQTVGTYSSQGNTLTFNMTQQGQATTTVWEKQ